MTTQLENYTKAVQTVKNHIEDNKEIFDAHQKLVMSVIDTENELRDAIAERVTALEADTSEAGIQALNEFVRTGAMNGSYKVTATPQTQTWADIEELDKEVSSGRMSKETRDRIVKTQKRPAKISITELK
jgi:hypothetical protein